MNKKLSQAGMALALLSLPVFVHAADHLDSPQAMAEPTADLADLFAWMDEDAEKLNLAMTVAPFAAASMQFSSAVQYVFHVNSSTGYGEEQTEETILCQFTQAPEIECWVGDEYVIGDASAEGGVANAAGSLRVYAGLRDDPFFMEFDGFAEAVATVQGAGALPSDEEGCPLLEEETRSALVGQLQSGKDGAPASDTYAGQNVLALVVQLDKTLVSAGGPVLGVWASTHAAE